jgi:hypothetical protein
MCVLQRHQGQHDNQSHPTCVLGKVTSKKQEQIETYELENTNKFLLNKEPDIPMRMHHLWYILHWRDRGHPQPALLEAQKPASRQSQAPERKCPH